MGFRSSVVAVAVDSVVVSEATIPESGSEGWRYRRDAIIREGSLRMNGTRPRERNRRSEQETHTQKTMTASTAGGRCGVESRVGWGIRWKVEIEDKRSKRRGSCE